MSGAGDRLDSDNLKQLAAQKEREWREVQELRAKSLDAALKEKENELAEEHSKFVKLKEDFKYNLRLLNERDAELEKYDAQFSAVKQGLSIKDAEISELKIKLDDLQAAVRKDQEAKEQLQMHYQHRVREKQAEVDKYKSTKDAEINREREELETFKRNLERQLRELEEEMDSQRNELNTGFEEALRKREHEWRKQADGMSTKLTAQEIKVKMLSKELELARTSRERTFVDCEESASTQRDLEKQLKQTQWQLDDVTAIKDARISELDSHLQHAEQAQKRIKEDFNRRHAELDRLVKEKELMISKLRESHHAQEQELQVAIQSLQSRVEQLELDLRQAIWSRDDAIQDKDKCIERLENELSDVKTRWDAHVQEISKSNVGRDVELESLREDVGKLRSELDQRKLDIDRYKKELNSASEREAHLERSKAQLELDWQRRFDDIERTQYERSEDLVKNLSQARDKALADLNERNRELAQKEELLKVLTLDRDQALATLRQHGLQPDRHLEVSQYGRSAGSASDQVAELQQQNLNLKTVIAEMRLQMESLGQSMPRSAGARVKNNTEAYVTNLEEQIQKLKADYRKLGHEIQQSKQADPSQLTQKITDSTIIDNTVVKSHIQSLNDMIGTFRSEKVELTAEVRKQQARIQHYENIVEKMSVEPRQKQVELSQLQYELGAGERRHEAEVSGLRKQVSDLQLQLIETRKEADEYHKAALERNVDISTLGEEISSLKIDLSQKRQPMAFGAQELMIQQLQDEITRLQKQLRGQQNGNSPDHVALSEPIRVKDQSAQTVINELQHKLRLAAKHISQLARDKQQLIDMGNMLRGQLMQAESKQVTKPRSYPHSSMRVDESQPELNVGSLADKVQSKLSQLENLQYELTKKELGIKKGWNQDVPPVVLESSTDEEDRPPSILKKPSSQPKLSPVTEDMISRPRTAPENTVMSSGYPRSPVSARSEPGYRSARGDPQAGQLLLSMSSVGGESIQEIWRMLDDEGISPMSTATHDMGQYVGQQVPERHSSSDIAVKGQPASVYQKNKPKSTNISSKAVGKPTKKVLKPKIRNYNVREDRDIR